MNETELKHWGILGMKWGRRRTQEQLDRLQGKVDKYISDQEIRKAQTSSSGGTTARRLEDLSDQELRDRISRLTMEKQYSDIVNGKVSIGQKYLKKTLDTSGNVLAGSSSALNMAMAMKKARGISTAELELQKGVIDSTSNIVKASNKINTSFINAKKAKRPAELDFIDDKTLRELVNRMSLEQQYKTITSEQINRGKANFKQVLEVAGSLVAITSSAIGIAQTIKSARKAAEAAKAVA